MNSEDVGNNGEAEATRPKLAPEVQDALGRKVRAAYRHMVSEPIPNKFRELLDRLARSEKNS